MSKPVSALDGAIFKGLVTVKDIGPTGMITIRCDLGDETLAKALTDVLGAPIPDLRKIATGNSGQVAWMSPDELLCLVDYVNADQIVADLAEALSNTHALVVNVSDARAHFVIEGAGLRDVLAKVMPVDFTPEAFQPGDFRRSRLAQVAAAVWMPQEGRAEIICFRSVAQYVMDVLTVSAHDRAEVGFNN